MKKIKIEANIINEAAHNLAQNIQKILKEKKFKDIYIVGINRGGLIPLGYLSYFLNTRNTCIIDINLYPNEKLREIKKSDIRSVINQLQFVNYLTEKDLLIFVDDLIDSGSTFKVIEKALRSLNNRALTINCVLFGKPNDLNIIYGKIKPEGWLVFPWDEFKKEE